MLPLYSCTTDPNSVAVRWPDLTATEAEKCSLVLSPRRGEIGFDEQLSLTHLCLYNYFNSI